MVIAIPASEDVRNVLVSAESLGFAADSTVDGPLRVGGSRGLYRVTDRSRGTSFAVKLCTDPTDARRQFAALSAAAAILNRDPTARTRVPEPVAVIEHRSMIVMGWVEGRSCERILLSPLSPPGWAADCARQAGAWLARFHDLSDHEAAVFDFEHEITRINEEVAELDGADGAQEVAKGWRDVLRRSAGDNQRVPLPIRQHHGDFKPANLLISGEAVFGIDLQGQYRCSVVQDIVHFLVDMELCCYHPLGMRLLPWRKRLVRAFLDGYGIPAGSPLARVVRWMRLHEIVRTWTYLHHRDGNSLLSAFPLTGLRIMARNA